VIAKTDFSLGDVQARAAMLTPTSMGHPEGKRSRAQHCDEDVNRLVDSTLEDSFPASDPPSWTASVARPVPARQLLARARDIDPVRRALQRAAALF